MSLLHPTPGELLDRLLIVRLKIEHAPTLEIRDRFVAEEHELTSVIPPMVWGMNLAPTVESLLRVHRALWDANFTLSLPAQNTGLAGNFARLIFKQNNQRLQLITAIDKTLGTYQGPEKLYPEFQ